MGFALKFSVNIALFVLAISPLIACAESGENMPSAPSALAVYNDYYVPDSVRAKYNLGAASFEARANTQAEQMPPSPPYVPQDVPQVQPAPNVAPVVEGGAVQRVESWRARKGENLRVVLSRWAARQSIDLNWDSKRAPDLDKDFSFVGKFEDAVNALLKETAGSNLQSQMTTPVLQK